MPVKTIIARVKQYRGLGIELAWVIAAQVFMLVGGLLTIKLLSNLLEKQEFGLYALIFSVASLLVSWLYTPLGHINMRFLVLSQEQGRVESFYQDQKKLLWLVSIFVLLILMPATLYLQNYTGRFVLTYVIVALLTLAMGVQSAQQYLLMAFRLRHEGSTSQMIGAITRPLCAVLALFLWGKTAHNAVLGLAAGFFILSMAQYYFLKKPWQDLRAQHSGFTPKYVPLRQSLYKQDYLSYGLFYALLGLVVAIVFNADRWLLSVFGTMEQLGIYAALMQISLAAAAFAHAVLTRLAAPIYFKAQDKQPEVESWQFLLLLSFWLLLSTMVLGMAWAFHPQIVVLITNSSFAQYSWLLPWMTAGLLLERTVQILELRGAKSLKTNIYVMARVLYAVLVIGLEYLFLHLYGFDFIAYGLVLAGLVAVFLVTVINMKLQKRTS